MHGTIKAFVLWGVLVSITFILLIVFVFYPKVANTPVVIEEILEEEVEETTPEYTDMISVTTPQPNDIIESPLTISGEARGWWYFEATFPVELKTESGEVLASWYAEAQSDWMSESFVPFEAEVSFTFPEGESPTRGVLILHRSNASGLPEHDASIEIPVRFSE